MTWLGDNAVVLLLGFALAVVALLLRRMSVLLQLVAGAPDEEARHAAREPTGTVPVKVLLEQLREERAEYRTDLEGLSGFNQSSINALQERLEQERRAHDAERSALFEHLSLALTGLRGSVPNHIVRRVDGDNGTAPAGPLAAGEFDEHVGIPEVDAEIAAMIDDPLHMRTGR